jgi:hypothetical protein
VSGGSVLAAHLVLNWEKYNEPKEFDGAARELIQFIESGARGGAVNRWVFRRFFLIAVAVAGFPWAWAVPLYWSWIVAGSVALFVVGILLAWSVTSWSRCYSLAREYERLFNKKTLADLSKAAVTGDDAKTLKRPDVHLLSTVLNTGEMCSFSGQGFTWWNSKKKRETVPKKDNLVSVAVAASSSFPPAFSPLFLSRKALGKQQREMSVPYLLLTDGGVFDNSGVSAVLLSLPEGTPCELIVSSAERELDYVGHGLDWFRGVWHRSMRANDIIMLRVSEYQGNEVPKIDEKAHIIRLAAPLERTQLTPETSLLVQQIRTELDRFSKEEIQLLVYYGYQAAMNAYENEERQRSPFKWTRNNVPYVDEDPNSWLPFGDNDMRDVLPEEALKNSMNYSWGSILKLPIALTVGVILLALAARLYYQCRPTGLSFESVFRQTTGKDSERHILAEISEDPVLEAYRRSLRSQTPSPPRYSFVAVTKPLGEYCGWRTPSPFSCTVQCRDQNATMQVRLFLRHE